MDADDRGLGRHRGQAGPHRLAAGGAAGDARPRARRRRPARRRPRRRRARGPTSTATSITRPAPSGSYCFGAAEAAARRRPRRRSSTRPADLAGPHGSALGHMGSGSTLPRSWLTINRDRDVSPGPTSSPTPTTAIARRARRRRRRAPAGPRRRAVPRGRPARRPLPRHRGRIAIAIANPIDRRESVVALMETGDLFGEMGMLDDRPRSAMARALEPSTRASPSPTRR